ncbi:MAG: hypothetical protein KGQ66_14285 [Acidobacteriota bacterium]|nr:hypothetical protein [Acidobacteriota bacterium]
MALTARLNARRDAVVEMSFAEMDRLVPGGLPLSARKQLGWWANSRTAQPQARAWLDAGRRADPDFGAGVVRFARAPDPVDPVDPAGSVAAAADPEAAGRRSATQTLPAVPAIDASVHVEWKTKGYVTRDAGRLRFPVLAPVPGLYRFTLTGEGGERVYIGESDDLRRTPPRRRDSAAPLPMGRLQAAVAATLAGGGTVVVSYVSHARLDGEELDLSSRAIRKFLQTLVVLRLSRAGSAAESL